METTAPTAVAATATVEVVTADVARATMPQRTKTKTAMQQTNKVNWRVLTGLFLICVLSACSSVYDETHTLDNQSWLQGEAVKFSFDIQDTTALYDIFLEVKHGAKYPYQNLYCWITTVFPNGETRREQHSLELANAKGYWLGECNDESCDRRIPFVIKTAFPYLGRYEIQFEQHSRQATLSPIEHLRLTVNKSS